MWKIFLIAALTLTVLYLLKLKSDRERAGTLHFGSHTITLPYIAPEGKRYIISEDEGTHLECWERKSETWKTCDVVNVLPSGRASGVPVPISGEAITPQKGKP